MMAGAIALREPDDAGPEGSEWPAHEAIEAANRRLRILRERFGGLRVHEAFFRVPWPLTRSQYEQCRAEEVGRWLAVMERKGWGLASKVHVKRHRPAYSYRGDWGSVPLLDQREVVVLAAFQMASPKPQRIEVLVAAR